MAGDQVSAVTAPTQFVESKGRRLAYRSFGTGEPLLLCVRLRGVLDVLGSGIPGRTGPIPILVISGDHEIVFPLQTWFDRVPAWRSLHLLVIPQAGHAAHHQEPEFIAGVIANFAAHIQ